MPTCSLGLAKKGKEKEKPKNSRKERSWTWGPARTKERKMNEVCAAGGTDVEKRQETGSEKQLRKEKENKVRNSGGCPAPFSIPLFPSHFIYFALFSPISTMIYRKR